MILIWSRGQKPCNKRTNFRQTWCQRIWSNRKRGCRTSAPTPSSTARIYRYQMQCFFTQGIDFNIMPLSIDLSFHYLILDSDPNSDNSRLPTSSELPNDNDNNMRNALLGSISGFNKGKLKKCDTIDKSGPKI